MFRIINRQPCGFVCLFVRMCVINFVNKISQKLYLWIFAKFITDTACTAYRPVNGLTFGADHTQDGGERAAQNLQFQTVHFLSGAL